jgi:RNA polymerase sigma-70 factor (ECF subfamily)
MKTAGAQPVARISNIDTPDAAAIDGDPAGASENDSSQPGQPAPAQDFHQLLEALLPRLTRYARVLTRDPAAADDLVQECLTRALGKMHLWEEGTDLRAWLFTILHHQYVSLTRRQARQRAGTELQKSYRSLAVSPNQTTRLELRDLERALAALPEEQRSVIMLVGLEGMRYDEAASLVKLPVGTVRSRVSRGRETLRNMTELFPSHHSPRPHMPASLNSPRRRLPDGDQFRPIPGKPVSASTSQEVLQ